MSWFSRFFNGAARGAGDAVDDTKEKLGVDVDPSGRQARDLMRRQELYGRDDDEQKEDSE